MKSNYSYFSFLILLIILPTGCRREENNSNSNRGKFANPVWEGQDPWMVKHNNDYIYSFSTNNSIVVSRSNKMTSLGSLKTIWQAPSSGWNSRDIWAPEIHYINDRWYVYYAAGEGINNFNTQRTGVLRSRTSDVFSHYDDLGMLYTGDTPSEASTETNIWAIDMTVFQYKGIQYAVWSGWLTQTYTSNQTQHLYICKMAVPYMTKGKRVRISSPTEDWEKGGPLDLNEGPQILQNSEKLFIVYSCRESWLAEYRLGMLELINPDGDLMDPSNWKKTGPVFTGNTEVYGVGHCSFVKSQDNEEDWIVYHSKKHYAPGWERDVRMQPFKWNSDGSPYFGRAIPAGVEIFVPSGE